jgi:hypothetical protein
MPWFPTLPQNARKDGARTLFSEPEKLLMKKAISALFARASAAD